MSIFEPSGSLTPPELAAISVSRRRDPFYGTNLKTPRENSPLILARRLTGMIGPTQRAFKGNFPWVGQDKIFPFALRPVLCAGETAEK
jgi:hypothetical protein